MRSHITRGSMGARAMSSGPTIIYTETDEAPNLATNSFLPVVEKMVALAGIDVAKSDISLSGRVLSQFPDKLKADQVIPDNLATLGDLAKTPEAIIVKLVVGSVTQTNARFFRWLLELLESEPSAPTGSFAVLFRIFVAAVVH